MQKKTSKVMKESENRVKKRLSKPTQKQKREVLKFLKDPNLLQNILDDIQAVSGIAGERTNQKIIYLAYTSRQLDKPISFLIHGQSATGKSYLANQIIEFIPPTDKMILSALTTKALTNIKEKDIKHKAILIQEQDAMIVDEFLKYTIRTIQSEGKITTLTSVPQKKGDWISKYHEAVIPCSLNTTTAELSNQDQNATRIFTLKTDESRSQTKRIYNSIRNKYGTGSATVDKKSIIARHHLLQNLLKKYPIEIPYAQHIKFTTKSTRGRRDLERFLILIQTVTHLYQHQRKIKNGVLLSDLQDYKLAYQITVKILPESLRPLSDRELNVLKVIKDMYDKGSCGTKYYNIANDGTGVDIRSELRVKQIIEHSKYKRANGKTRHLDLSNINNTREIVKSLVEKDYLTSEEGFREGKAIEVHLTDDDINPEAKLGLLTPSQLKAVSKL